MGGEADARLERMEAQLAALLDQRVGPAPAAPEMSVAQLYEKFTRAYKAKPSWRKAPRWAAYREQRRDADGRKAGVKLSPLTINFELDWAKRMFNWAMEPEQGLLAANPLAKAKRERVRQARETWLTEDDVQVALSASYPSDAEVRVRLHAFFLNIIDTGLRFNEMRKLRRDRCRARADSRVLADVGRTKNGKTHFVALTARGWAGLRDIPHVVGSPYFFCHAKTGELYHEQTMRRWFRLMMESAGLDTRVADGDVRLRVHDCRRSAATAADRRGASLSAIQDMLNHSNPGITVRYIRRSEESAVQLSLLMENGAAAEREATKDGRRDPHRAVHETPTRNPKSTTSR